MKDEHDDTRPDDTRPDETADTPYDDEWREGEIDEDDWPTPYDTGRGALVAACLVGVVTTLVLVLLWSLFTRGGDEPEQAAEGPDSTSLGSISDGAAAEVPAARTTRTRLSRCVSAQQALQDPLEAAQPALDQWAVHVGAMNKLVLGEITLQQATDFWNQTRVGAHRGVDGFHDAVDVLRREGVDCPSPVLLAPGARALPACAREVQAEARALRAAQVSVATWNEHIHHMDMLRLGEMTPEEATRMWLASWQAGVRDLDAYKAAAREARAEDGCSQAGSTR